MTTEEDFQAALDANPDDHSTRLVFADWLDEHDDPRAKGYRALGTLRHEIRPFAAEDIDDLQWDGWYALPAANSSISWPAVHEISVGDAVEIDGDRVTVWFRTRRRAEDAAALAFGQLSASDRFELMH